MVEEIPLRPPSGRGDYLWILVEKRRMSTPELLRRLSARLRVPSAAIRVAGNKDSDAITRQWVSLPWSARDAAKRLDLEGVRILDGERDHAPLRTGELEGNEFTIALSGVPADRDVERRALEVLEILRRRGVPNFFGPQRFGTRGNAARVGELLLLGKRSDATAEFLGGGPDVESDPSARRLRELFREGDLARALAVAPRSLVLERNMLEALLSGKSPDSVWRDVPQPDRRMLLSAFQSLLFNRMLVERLDRIDVALRGDRLLEIATGRIIECDDPARYTAAVAAFELSPTGWLIGNETRAADGEMGAIERAVIDRNPIPEANLNRPLELTLPGERRPLRVRIGRVAAELDADSRCLWLRFRLSKGAFATAVLAEIQKAPDPIV